MSMSKNNLQNKELLTKIYNRAEEIYRHESETIFAMSIAKAFFEEYYRVCDGTTKKTL